jgi:putative ABC transport system ATP-binding protein
MIELENVKKSFRAGNEEITILKGINLMVCKGEFVSIMGPSGSGKTTLASILGCLSSPSSGSYKLNDETVSQLAGSKLAGIRNRYIGYVFQDFNLLEGLSAVDNVALPLVYAGVDAKVRTTKAISVLEDVGLGERLYHTPRQLSGGQKQRVAIARALVNNPDLIFADEPTGALDQKTSREIMELMQDLNLKGHTIVQVTHSEEDSRYSKRIIHIMDGLIIKDEFIDQFLIGKPSDEKEVPWISGRLWRVLGVLKPEQAVELSYFKRLFEAAKVLIQYEDSQLGSIINRLFLKGNWAVRAEIIKNCDVTTHDFAIGYILRGLKDENSWVRFLAINKLSKCADELKSLCESEQIAALLSDTDERVRGKAIYLVSKENFSKFKSGLLATIKNDKNSRVRSNALERYAEIIEESGADLSPLEFCLDDSHHRVRTTAAVLLKRLFPEQCLKVVLTLSESQNTVERSAGVWGLGYFIKSQLARSRIDTLMLHEEEEMVVSQTVNALARHLQGVPVNEEIAKLLAVS